MSEPDENKVTSDDHENGHGHEDDHDKGIEIIVNGRAKTIPKNDALTYNQLVVLAFDNPPSGPNIVFTITYRRGCGNKPEGTLAEDESVRLKDGMIFNVTATDKS